MPPANDVVQTIQDGALGNVLVPPANAQAHVGCSSSGTANQVLATQSKATVISTFGFGPLVEKMCMCIDAGGLAIGCKAPTITNGAVLAKASASIASSTNANPIVVTTSTPHGLSAGDQTVIAGHLVNTNANGTWPVTPLTATTFSIPATGNGVGAATGTETPTGGNFIGTGTSAITLTGTPFDDYRLQFKVGVGGTIGITGITFQLSLDQGRTFGPPLNLGTATTYQIPQSGITLNFAAGTLVAQDLYSATTTAPLWNDAGVQAAITALNASSFQWGAGIHVVGKSAGADASTFQGYLDTLAVAFRYTFAFLDTRDTALITGETESVWIASLNTDYSGVGGGSTTARICAGAGYYNTPSSVPNPQVGGLPRYRRPGTWAASCRAVTVAPWVLLSRVLDGSLSRIAVNPTLDAVDGNVYHDERVNPGLGPSGASTGRFMTMRTRIGSSVSAAFFVDEPAMMAPAGSDYTLLPYRQVVDIACTVEHQVLTNYINSGVRVNPNGTIIERDARSIESAGQQALNDNLTNKGAISSGSFTLSRADNLTTTKTLTSTTRLVALGYILEIDNSIGFQSPAQVLGS